ncbi:MAG: putative transrane protein [Rhodospirillales bacterium]|jgi:uncharacterized SAM-binding protein YcdF (DUF218 family)|nr:putative transrane protein [Rhodospirillales bacterium]
MNRTDIAELLLPPVGLLWLLLVAIFMAHTRRLRALLLLVFAALWILGSPMISRMALRSLALSDGAQPAIAGAALLVLGGDVSHDANGYEAGAASEARVREAARRAKVSNLPVIVSGGPLYPDEPAVANLMAQSFADRGIEALVEDRAKDTCENLRYGAALARDAGIEGPLLVVTHAWHMRRAMIAAELVGAPALPAPLPLEALPRKAIRAFLPSPRGWGESYWALHEWLGVLTYRAGLCR